MHYYFTLLILVVISLANAHWGPGHRNTPEKERLNAKIKNEFHDILAITSPGGHDNLSETIDDVFKGLIREFDKFPIDESFISILNTLDGVVAHDTENSAREPNLLTPLLRPPKYAQAGAYYEESEKTRDIYDFMGELANRYVELLKQEGEDKEIHAVPIGMVVGKLDERPRENKGLYTTLFLGVLGKRNRNSNNLTGIAGIAATDNDTDNATDNDTDNATDNDTDNATDNDTDNATDNDTDNDKGCPQVTDLPRLASYHS